MTPDEIKDSLKKVDVKQTTIAQKLKVNRCTINRVILRQSESRRVKQAIAEAIGQPYDVVWG